MSRAVPTSTPYFAGRPCLLWVMLAVSLTLPLVGACVSSSDKVSSSAANSRPTVVLPELSQLEGPVREQIRARHAALTRQAENPRTPPGELGNAYGELGEILGAAGYQRAAEAAYLNACALAPREMRWAYYLGHHYGRMGERREAARFFERALELEPDNVPALASLGDTYLDQGRADEAEEVFTRLLSHHPNSAVALYGIGRAALGRHETARAIESLERALAIDPRATSLHYSLGLAYRQLGELDKASEHLTQRGQGIPTVPDPLLRAAAGLLNSTLAYETRGLREMEAGRFDEAAGIFRDGLRATPDDPQLRHRLGAALMFAGDAVGATAELETVLRVTPDFEQAHFSLGVIASMSGRPNDAIDRFAAAVELRPNYLEARLGLAEALRLTGRLEEALAQYERVVEIDPAFAEAWMVRGVTLVELERYGEARVWLQRGVAVHPGHPDLTDLLARVLAAAPDESVRDGAQALTLMDQRRGAPASVELQETLAMVLAEAGRFDEAVAWQRQAIEAARQPGQNPRLRFMSRNLSLYESGRPSREPLEKVAR